MFARRATLALPLVAALAATAAAQDRRGRPAANPEQQQAGPGVLSLLPGDAVSEHTVETGGTKLTYTATVGTLNLYDQSGERTAAIVYTAYVLKDRPAETRPVTFAFNGGPGAASAYLHLG